MKAVALLVALCFVLAVRGDSKCTTDTVNFRNGPCGTVISQIGSGAQVSVVGSQNVAGCSLGVSDWTQVYYNGQIGWVASQYLTSCSGGGGGGSGTCGGNCPGGRCTECPCGTNSDYTNIAQACASYSGWDQACCRCIASHESGGNLHAMNKNVGGSYDVGLWQINDVNWGQCSNGVAPCDFQNNLDCAIKVWRWGGNSFRLWSTCGACGCC